MSYRIHRAIGWGMPWHQFESLTTLDCEGHETHETLNRVFDKVTDEQLTVPDDVREASFRRNYCPPIIETRLLARNFTDGGREPADLGKSEDLYCVMSDPRDTLGVVFYPNLYYSKDWYRFDDSMDYAFERWRESSEPRQFVEYVAYGHYPFTNYLMLEDGTPHEWLSHWALRDRPDLLPAVPSEIRWYLNKLGVMDDAGVNKLRPCIAQWWG